MAAGPDSGLELVESGKTYEGTNWSRGRKLRSNNDDDVDDEMCYFRDSLCLSLPSTPLNQFNDISSGKIAPRECRIHMVPLVIAKPSDIIFQLGDFLRSSFL
jgi:hypothetical protein